jgi:hypothetical protein
VHVVVFNKLLPGSSYYEIYGGGVPQNLEFQVASGQIIPIGDRTDINVLH